MFEEGACLHPWVEFRIHSPKRARVLTTSTYSSQVERPVTNLSNTCQSVKQAVRKGRQRNEDARAASYRRSCSVAGTENHSELEGHHESCSSGKAASRSCASLSVASCVRM